MLKRESPNLFAERPITMIGRSKKDKTWKTFVWTGIGELCYEYAPLKESNKHLIDTTEDYGEETL